MIFLIYSETAAATIAANLGAPEYSYYFVLKEFRPVLEEFGIVIAITDPVNEVDRIWRNAARHGEACIFLTFSPPHRTFVPAECPTIPIFAWEFDTLPSETWDDDWRHDWRRVLARTGRAITHSAFAVGAVEHAMGADYPVISLPAPVWDEFAAIYDQAAPPVADAPVTIDVRGRVFDSRLTDFSLWTPTARRAQGFPGLQTKAGREDIQSLTLGGVIYTAVLCPMDGRKNWFDLLCGFCWALRDASDATLVLKLTHRDCDVAVIAILEDMAKLSPFACRVVLIDGYLSGDSYRELARLSTYTVNTSHGEGQCLPLMEYMSAGKPAVAPDHTAMADYIAADNAFIVASHPEPTIWPHDPRQSFRTRRYRIDFESVLAAYRESYLVATQDPARYRHMAAAAHGRLHDHCARAVLKKKLRDFVLAAPALAPSVPSPRRHASAS